MLKDVVEVRPLGDYRVHLRFEDGVESDIDLGDVIEFKGVFAPLRDSQEFAKLRIHPELGTVVWPNGADLDLGQDDRLGRAADVHEPHRN